MSLTPEQLQQRRHTLGASEIAAIPFAPGYFVTPDARIFSSTRERKLVTDRDGYLRVGLRIDGKTKLVGVHRIVCWTFNGPPADPSLEARHLDGVKSNNAPSNLAWGTRKENAEDMMRHGGHRAQTRPDTYGPSPKIAAAKRFYWETHERPRGSLNPASKLDEVAVASIKSALAAGQKHRDIAARFGVSRSSVSLISQGKTWNHVRAA